MTAELEDDFHHFRVTVEHNGARRHRCARRGRALPLVDVPVRGRELEPLVGMSLSTRSTAVGDVVSARDNCMKVTFFCGISLLPVPPGGTERSKDARWIDIYEGDEFDEALLGAWVMQAAALPGWDPGRPSPGTQ